MRKEKVYELLTSAAFQPQSRVQHQLQLREFALTAEQPSSDHQLAKGHMDWELPAEEVWPANKSLPTSKRMAKILVIGVLQS